VYCPELKESVSKVDVKVGDSYYYNCEISNPFPHPIKYLFEDKLSQGLSFAKIGSINSAKTVLL